MCRIRTRFGPRRDTERLGSVAHPERELSARAVDELVRETIRGLGPACDDDLVGRKGAQRVARGLKRIGITDEAEGSDAPAPQLLERRRQALRGTSAGGVFVGEPVAKPRNSGGGDDEDLGAQQAARNSSPRARTSTCFLMVLNLSGSEFASVMHNDTGCRALFPGRSVERVSVSA